MSRYILCVSFRSLLSAVVHLLPQINVHKNMRTALFYVVCALPVFMILHSAIIRTLKYDTQKNGILSVVD